MAARGLCATPESVLWLTIAALAWRNCSDSAQTSSPRFDGVNSSIHLAQSRAHGTSATWRAEGLRF